MRLTLAVPSKGRLQENTIAFFARSGVQFVKEGGEREYRGTLKGVPNVDVLYLSASEIAKELALGNVHLGITGADLVHENLHHPLEKVGFITPLHFGFADVVVAVPNAWIDVTTMQDLDEVALQFHAHHKRRMRVATKYINLTRQFFKAKGVSDYQIVESLGATEGAPASGAAELIVDITTTGATLQANGLKILEDGVMLPSQAYLVASKTASWSDMAKLAAKELLDRLQAERAARAMKELRCRHIGLSQAHLEEATRLFNVQMPFGGPTSTGMLTLHCPEQHIYALVKFLREKGVTTLAVTPLELVYGQENPLYNLLETMF
jgi:ATP phosphoribosyltransferase